MVKYTAVQGNAFVTTKDDGSVTVHSISLNKDGTVADVQGAEFWAFSAQQMLAATDYIPAQCIENGIPVPSEWVSYRNALRAIVAADGAGTSVLPAQPADPAW